MSSASGTPADSVLGDAANGHTLTVLATVCVTVVTVVVAVVLVQTVLGCSAWGSAGPRQRRAPRWDAGTGTNLGRCSVVVATRTATDHPRRGRASAR